MKYTLLCIILLGSQILKAQNRNLSLMSNLPMNSELSGIWGYTDETGREYGLMGLVTGSLAIVDVTDGTKPFEVFRNPGFSSNWREIKTWKDVAYISTEASAGLQIIDMSGLPQNTDLPYQYFTDSARFRTVHTIWIDEEGLLYIWGSDVNAGKKGYKVYDLKPDPLHPTPYFTFEDTPYIHDGFIKGNRMYLSHIYAGYFSIYDVSDKKKPILLGTQITPNQFTHNTWPTMDNKFLLTTDERQNSFLTAYNIADPANIYEVDRIQTKPGSNAIVHNTHLLGDFAISSYYTEGITIHDISDPENLIEVGKYDCSPFSGGTFNGVWEVYPFFSSGKVIAGDIEEGLFVFQPTYKKGCYIHGSVRDSVSGQILPGVNVEISATGIFATSRADGTFKTGIGVAGTYSLTLRKNGYKTRLVNGVQLNNGVVVRQDLTMIPTNVGVQESLLDLVSLYPNPVMDELHVELNGAELTSIEILSVDGKVIQGFTHDKLSDRISLDMESGVYIIRLTETNGAVQLRKIFKV